MKEVNNTNTIVIEEDSDFIDEISEYLDVLSNSKRLKILKLIEKESKDTRTISKDIKTTYENTKKHLDKLVNIGLIIKEVGLGKQTVRGAHPVWRYSLVPGSLEVILRNLGIFSNIKFKLSDMVEKVKIEISEEFKDKFPIIRVLGGTEDGKVFKIKKNAIKIGRVDPKKQDKYDLENDIILSGDYKSITRVSNPHAILTFAGNDWYIEDCDSKGGTYLNNERLDKFIKIKLNNGDMIGLAKGVKGSLSAHLLFSFLTENKNIQK